MGTTAINFDANGVKPETGFEPVPNNWYRAMVIESEVKPTKDSRPDAPGAYLQLTWQVLEGEFKTRKIWSRLNVQNPSAEAQRIGQAQLSAVCHATGVMKLTSSTQLHNIPTMIKVVVKPGSAGFDPSNEIKEYKAIPGATPVAAAAAAPTSNATPAAAAPAWAQKK